MGFNRKTLSLRKTSVNDILIFMFVILGTLATSSCNTQNADRLTLPSICRLTEEKRTAGPLSCWCYSRPTAHFCQNNYPYLHLPQEVKELCGTNTRCCLTQVIGSSDVYTNSILNLMNTNEDRVIQDFLTFCDIGRKDNDNEASDTLPEDLVKESLGLPETGYPNVRNDSPSVKEMESGIGHLHREDENGRPISEDLQNIANSFLIQTDHFSERALNDTNVWIKAFSLVINFLNSTISNRIQNANTTNSDIDKNDLVDDFNKLGWLSKAAEVAVDISLYAGVAFGIMYLSGTLLSGFIASVWKTCFICYFLENFDLVPVSPNLQ